jgi:hypothetical protein
MSDRPRGKSESELSASFGKTEQGYPAFVALERVRRGKQQVIEIM